MSAVDHSECAKKKNYYQIISYKRKCPCQNTKPTTMLLSRWYDGFKLSVSQVLPNVCTGSNPAWATQTFFFPG